LLQANREVGLEVNAEITKCTVMSDHQNAGQNDSLLTAHKSLENVARFKYFGATVTSQIAFMKNLRD
jgi:hypothetical protein